uniref:Maturase K n=1 Tax=Ditylenchus dipsaci TaxID=166011 RepID=A0A915DT59_9BILA
MVLRFGAFLEQDAYLSFLHSFTIAYLSSHPKWSRSLECFANPLDELWNDYLHRLTPSFMLMSLENPSRAFVNEDIDFSSRFISIAIHLITSNPRGLL